MKRHEILAAMISPLCSWYETNKRDFPWRKSRDAYRVWVSEIMLQQTRCAAAIPYYHRFLAELPTVFDLAAAPEEQLLKLWEGLGYYSRVRNMQKAAKAVVEQFGGEFPRNAKDLSRLPGVGAYTAGAVASIAFGLPEPAVDGNVLRVLARLCDDDRDIMLPTVKKEVHEALKEVYPMAKDCGDLTQAIMELGAIVCLPGGAPLCDACPLAHLCQGKARGREQELPIRITKKEKKEEKRTIFLLSCDDKIALSKRPEKGVLAGMWEFPAKDGWFTEEEAKEALKEWGGYEAFCQEVSARHVFTHLIWEMQSFSARMKSQDPGFTWVTLSELTENIALPSAMKKFFEVVKKRKEGQS